MSLRSHRPFIKPSDAEDSKRVAPPSHRHAAPSAPWPWVDIEDEVDKKQLETSKPPIPAPCDHKSCGGCWPGYPQSLFPNWTPGQVEKCKIKKAIDEYRRDVECKIRMVDVDDHGLFRLPEMDIITSTDNTLQETWQKILDSKAPDDTRVRALFIEHMSGPVLQMLGTRFNIEPFFFSSSLNWIPSRYEEEVVPGVGDHITICLTFLRSMPNADAIRLSAASPYGAPSSTLGPDNYNSSSILVEQMIDTQAPLDLVSNGRLLLLDLLSVHLIRRKSGSMIISYHSDKDLPTTTAKYLHERIRFAGQSVYWQSMFQKSPDPTFVLLCFVWHAMYAWDEALENLYSHVCSLESQVITTSEMKLTNELHIIRAHLLHYAALLDDFRKTVIFIRDIPNPALDSLPHEEYEYSKQIMKRECANLLTEIERLESGRKMQDRRLKNVMNLVFSSVNILDSKRMQKMTEAAMKQVAYLTMVFLPASFVAAVFGMNVKEINNSDVKGTLPHYFAAAFPLTLATIWIVISFQSKHLFPEYKTFWQRLAWPVLLFKRVFGKEKLGGLATSTKNFEEAELDKGSVNIRLEEVRSRDS